MACTTSPLSRSLYLISSTTGLLEHIEACGGSIRALSGGIAESWPSKV